MSVGLIVFVSRPWHLSSHERSGIRWPQRLACATYSCRQIADQIVGRGAVEPGHGGMTEAVFRYKMGLVGLARGAAGQAAALS